MPHGPYRAPVLPAEPCRFHPTEHAGDACARCGAGACLGCVSFDGEHVLCPMCARSAGRRRRSVRALAAIVLALACALPAMAAPVRPREAPESMRDMSARVAMRECNQDELALVMLGLYRRDRHEEVLAMGEAFLNECGGPARGQMKQMMGLARARVARP